MNVSDIVAIGGQPFDAAPTSAAGAEAPAAGSVATLGRLAQAITGRESGGNPNAISPANWNGEKALGSRQIMEGTFKQYAQPGESFDNEAHRVAASDRKLADDFKFYNGDLAKTAAAYIGGRGAVRADGSIRDDVKDVLGTSPLAYSQQVLARMGKTGGARTMADAPRSSDIASISDMPVAPGQQPVKSDQDRTAGAFAKDMAIKAGQGVIDLGQSVVGAGDIVTGGLAGDAAKAIGYEPERAKQMLAEFLSGKQRRMEAEIEAAGKDKGLVDGFVDTLSSMARNPTAIPGFVAQSLPSMLAAGGGARALGQRIYTAAAEKTAVGGMSEAAAAVARHAEGKKALEAATGALKWAAAGGEGALTAGQIADQAREAGRTWGQYVLPAIAAGAGTALIGRAAGSIPGLGDAETAAFTGVSGAAATGNRLVRTIKGGIQEGVLEELPQSAQEQFFQNIAQGKPASEGVGAAAAQGLATGLAMGHGMGAISSGPTANAKVENPPPLLALPAPPVIAAGQGSPPPPPSGPTENDLRVQKLYEERDAEQLRREAAMANATKPAAPLALPAPDSPTGRSGFVNDGDFTRAETFEDQQRRKDSQVEVQAAQDIGLTPDVVSALRRRIQREQGIEPETVVRASPVKPAALPAPEIGKPAETVAAQGSQTDTPIQAELKKLEDRPTEIRRPDGRPFKTEAAAQRSRHPYHVPKSWSIKPVPGGFVWAAPEKPVKAAADVAQRLSDEQRKNMWRAIKNKGGINVKWAPELGIDPKSVKGYLLSGFLSQRGGMQEDGLAELLNQNGYQHDENTGKALGLVSDMLAREFVGTPEARDRYYSLLYSDHAEPEITQSGFDAVEPQQQEQIADYDDSMIEAVADIDILIPDESNVTTEEAMRSLGFSEQEIQDDARRNQQGDATAVGDSGAREAGQAQPGSAQSGGEPDAQPSEKSAGQPQEGVAPVKPVGDAQSPPNKIQIELAVSEARALVKSGTNVGVWLAQAGIPESTVQNLFGESDEKTAQDAGAAGLPEGTRSAGEGDRRGSEPAASAGKSAGAEPVKHDTADGKQPGDTAVAGQSAKRGAVAEIAKVEEAAKKKKSKVSEEIAKAEGKAAPYVVPSEGLTSADAIAVAPGKDLDLGIEDQPAGSWVLLNLGGDFKVNFSLGGGQLTGGDLGKSPEDAYKSALRLWTATDGTGYARDAEDFKRIPKSAFKGAGDQGGLTLESPTVAALQKRVDGLEKAAADKAKADKEAENKAKADAEVGGYALTGSDRAADANPGQGDIFGSVDAAAHEAAVSPRNDKPEPSKEQILGGNAELGHTKIAGMEISIENPAGSVRKDLHNDPPQWENKMHSHYGYFKATVGNDKDHIDVFIKPGTPEGYAGPVYVVNQKKANGHFDEHKVMLGFATEDEAKAGYLANYSDGWDGIKSIAAFTMDEFKTWLKDGDHTQLAETRAADHIAGAGKELSGDGFIKAPGGLIDFGEITPEMSKAMRRQAGKIRLERGDESFGERHIEARHGKQIRALGFESVAAFVADAIEHMDAIWQPSASSQLVVVESTEKGKAVYIELKPAAGGDFYTVNTAFPVSDNYAEKKAGWKELWSRVPVPADASGASPSAVSALEAGGRVTMDSGQSGASVRQIGNVGVEIANAEKHVAKKSASESEQAKAVAEPKKEAVPLDQITVEVTAIEAETGKRMKITERANVVMDDLDQQIITARALLECL